MTSSFGSTLALDTMAMAASDQDKASLKKLRTNMEDDGALKVVTSKNVLPLFKKIDALGADSHRDKAGEILQNAIKKDPALVARLDENLNPQLNAALEELARKNPEKLEEIMHDIVKDPRNIPNLVTRASAQANLPPPAPAPTGSKANSQDPQDPNQPAPEDDASKIALIIADLASIDDQTKKPKYPGFKELKEKIENNPGLQIALGLKDSNKKKDGKPDPEGTKAMAQQLQNLQARAKDDPAFFQKVNKMLDSQLGHSLTDMLAEHPEAAEATADLLFGKGGGHKSFVHSLKDFTTILKCFGGPMGKLGGELDRVVDSFGSSFQLNGAGDGPLYVVGNKTATQTLDPNARLTDLTQPAPRGNAPTPPVPGQIPQRQPSPANGLALSS